MKVSYIPSGQNQITILISNVKAAEMPELLKSVFDRVKDQYFKFFKITSSDYREFKDETNILKSSGMITVEKYQIGV